MVFERMYNFIDSHCHFDFPQFDVDRETVWKVCRESKGIKALVMPGVNPEQWAKLAHLSRFEANMYFGVGVHPWWINKGVGQTASSLLSFDQLYQSCSSYLGLRQCIAIGECGLDTTIDVAMAKQVKILEWHMQLAELLNLPIILHCVKAQNTLIEVMNRYPNVNGVVHAFSGSLEAAEQFWRRGFHLGIGGTITYGRASKTRNTVQRVPLEWLVLETDSPDMPLSGRQGSRNSPENLPDIAHVLAAMRHISVPELAEVVYQNTLKLFPKISV